MSPATKVHSRVQDSQGLETSPKWGLEKRVRLESESEKSPSPRKVRVRNEDSKNESNLSPYPHQRHMYDTSLESSRPPDGLGVIEICIPPLATPPEAKTLFWLLWCYKCTTLTKIGSFIHPVSNLCSYMMQQMYHFDKNGIIHTPSKQPLFI